MTPEAAATDQGERPPASVDDYNHIGREVPEPEIAAVEAAALEWSPPED